MKSYVILLTMAACLALVVPASAASYGTADLLESTVAPTTTMTAYFPGYYPNGIGLYSSTYYLNLTNVQMNPGVPFTVQSGMGFCIEAQLSSTAAAQYSIVDLWDAPVTAGPGVGGAPMGAAKAALINKLFGGAYSGLSTGAQIGAFQVALWEIVYESGSTLDATTGAFYATGNTAITTQANTWLSSLASYSDYNGKLVALSNNSLQDYVTVAVPEFPTAMLAPLGLAAMGLVRRKLSR